ncbi:Flagellar biosynthesis protein FlhB [Candidatus Hydrogenisulfobacillus filiaventi]|uniref:Flagellar biosynthesis protein FlhB n=1 Tax=Candidatus Hydrogenisulfobacillus filiaventi TaxID=2707344 RepID=A0A6F8ZE46_9FIRM|nr:Flagellar biosynthesis protein FlhB [Candidatus Hydrogenisulfobacillus filiaventi]
MATGGERTQQPTRRRLERARREGRAGWRSPDLQGAAGLLAAFAGLGLYGAYAGPRLAALFRLELVGAASPARGADWGTAIREAGQVLAAVAAPFVLALLVLGVGLAAAQGGLRFSLKAAAPDWSRVDPVRGLARLFSLATLWELGKGLLKLGAVGAVVGITIARQLAAYPALVAMPVGQALAQGAIWLKTVLVRGAAAYLAVALVDAGVQYRRHRQSLMMTVQEVREEFKETEGDPRLKSRRRELARRFLKAGLHRVADASVVITNPTHLAVALQWDAAVMVAPTVVAKGQDEMALLIRREAVAHGVPVVEDPPLARALYPVPLGMPIPAEHYRAVAAVLAFLIRRGRPEAEGGSAWT